MNWPSFLKSSLIIGLSVILVQCHKQPSVCLDAAMFQNPPMNKSVHTWWHWLDGAITKEGITKDLEAMKEQGVVQATILNIGLFGDRDFGVPRIKYNSPEWYEMFKWALQEANRLGITLGAHNCDGWSSTGGPWITPEMSMKQFIWTKTIVKGNQDLHLALQKPGVIQNYYKDVAVVAIKTNEEQNSFHLAAPAISVNDKTDASALADGCPASEIELKKGDWIQISFSNAFKAEKIVIHPRKSFMWDNPDEFESRLILSSSQDGKNFKKISELAIKGLNKTVSIPITPTTARFFRLNTAGLNNSNSVIPVTIGELELLQQNENPYYDPSVPFQEEKTGSIKPAREEDFYALSKEPEGKHSDESNLINLTDKMKADGTLECKVPEGNWTILRFGYTSTGARNAPATKEGVGLECDKMDTAALNLHFRNFPQKLIHAAGKFKGNTFKFFLIDSWECGFQNWTAGFPAEFEKRRGYSLINYLPVLCGETIGNSDLSEAVLSDFRKTIADLIEQNYYIHYSDLLHKEGIELHAEVIYGNGNYPPLDIMKTTRCVDLPMYEFWSGQNPKTSLIEYKPVASPELNFPACAALDYGKPMMASEAYTGFAHYSESPWELKPYGDRAFCAGISQIILHSYVHQPFDKKPGMTLGMFASHFNRNNLYWQYISGWFRYQSRIQYMLQAGTTSSDVLYYIGDQLPQYYVYNRSNTLPFGYNLNACNFDILKNKLTVVNGKIRLSGTTDYILLCLPPYPVMDFATLQRIEDLVKQGAIIYGPRPVRSLSLDDLKKNSAAFRDLADKLWGKTEGKAAIENSYGKGKVFWGMPAGEVLKKINVRPDFATSQPDSATFLFIHKKIGNEDAYFVCNQLNKPLYRECLFRVSDKTPEIWDPQYGTCAAPAIFSNENGRVRIPVTFGPYQSLIFVFRDTKPSRSIVTVTRDGITIFPFQAGGEVAAVPVVVFDKDSFRVFAGAEGNYTFQTSQKKSFSLKLTKPAEFELTDFEGTISFKAAYPASIPVQKINKLASFTENDNPDIRYFAGEAKYLIRFKAPGNFINSKDSVWLDLGKFETAAEVSLNGAKLGRLWMPGTMLNVTRQLKADNELEITVVNVYRNRFIGDFIQFGQVKNLWTSSPISNFLGKDKPLKPSGLLGPMRLICVKSEKL